MAVRYLDDGNDAGTVLGQDSSALVGFYGTTPVNQPATVADATDAATAITSCNSVIAALVEVGLLASA